jgi:phenylpyruvate tautomerase PptA (4-oxalocrotonate tautomerase family)
MPNIWVTGLDREQGSEFSRLASELFERELGTPRGSVYVFLREAVLFRDGVASELPTILQVSWIRRPREQFAKLVAGLTRIVKEDLQRPGSVQVELVEKWDDATIDGETCAAWAARTRR